MHIHHIALRIEVHVPHLFEELGAADDFLGVQEEVLEELEFLVGQVERLVLGGDLVPQPVQA